jgi:quaternary ammonium compound-resistance protein SugE
VNWIYLLLASLFEIGWPFGLKMAHLSPHKFLYTAVAIISMTLSGVFLYLAQRNIPLGTAYCIWTGLGAIGTFILGIMMFNDTITLMKFFGILFIIGGVVMLKMAA